MKSISMEGEVFFIAMEYIAGGEILDDGLRF